MGRPRTREGPPHGSPIRTSLVAVLIALAGTAMIVLYVQGIDARATKDQELVEVLIATETIDTGETVTAAQEAGKIEKAEVRRDDLVDGSLSSTSSISDLVAVGTIYPGEQLIATEVRQPGRHREPGDPGRQDGRLGRAHRLRACRRLRQPGLRGRRSSPRRSTRSRCCRTARSRSSAASPGSSCTRVPVIGVGTTSVTSRTTEGEGGARPRRSPRTILTIAVTQDEAEKLIHADRTTELNFALLDRRLQGRRPAPVSRPGDILPETLPEASAVTAILEPDGAQRAVLQAMLHGSQAFADLDGLEQHIRTADTSSPSSSGRPCPARLPRSCAQWARVHRPDLGVILLRHDVDSNTLALALRSGMREVVAARDLAGITTAVQRARSVANAIGQTMLDEVQAAAQTARAEVAAEVAKARGRRPGRGGRSSRQGHHRLLHQGWRGQEPGRHQPRRGAGGQRSQRVPGRPRRQQRRRRDHAPADPAAHDQRPGRLQRRHRRRRRRDRS